MYYHADCSETTESILSHINLAIRTHHFWKININAFPLMLLPLILLRTFKFSNWNGVCICYFPFVGYKLLPTRCKIPGKQNPKYQRCGKLKSLIASPYLRYLTLCGKNFNLNTVTSSDYCVHKPVVTTNWSQQLYNFTPRAVFPYRSITK
jgi:hypothetical protein